MSYIKYQTVLFLGQKSIREHQFIYEAIQTALNLVPLEYK